MSLGRFVNVGALIPFYMMLIIGQCKPMITIFLLGPPAKAFIVGEFEEYLHIDDPEEKQNEASKNVPSIAQRFKAEFFPSLFFASFLFVLLQDILNARKALLQDGVAWTDALGGALFSLSTSNNFLTLINVIGIVGLHGERDYGIGNMLGMLHRDEVPTWLQQIYDYIARLDDGVYDTFKGYCKMWVWLFLFAFLRLLLFATGCFATPLDGDSVRRMESRVQQVYVRTVWYTYKLPLHVLLTISLLGIVCYFWIFFMLFFLAIVCSLIATLLLNRVMRARACLGASAEEITATLKHIQKYKNLWINYLYLPSFFGLILPISMPLTLRLLGGDTYSEALAATWNDRHASTYFNHLWSEAETACSKAFVWSILVSASL